MARFWKEEDSKTESTFVPLPLDFLRQKIEGMQKSYDTAKFAAADAAKYAAINYIPGMEKDKAIADRVNSEKLKYAEDAFNALDPAKMSKYNPMGDINAAVENIMKAKMIESRITTQGTEEYQVNYNYTKMVEGFKKIDEYNMSEEEKLGRKQRLLDEYKVDQYGSKDNLNTFNDFVAPGSYDYQSKLKDIMKETTIDKNSGHIDLIGDKWITAKDWSYETRTPDKLALVAYSYITGDSNLRARLESEIRDRAFARYTDPKLRQEFIDREVGALQSGGFNAEAYNNLREKATELRKAGDEEGLQKLYAGVNWESMVDSNTIIGSLVEANIRAFKVANQGGGTSVKQNYLWDAANNRKYGEAYVIPSTGNAGETTITYDKLVEGIDDVFSVANKYKINPNDNTFSWNAGSTTNLSEEQLLAQDNALNIIDNFSNYSTGNGANVLDVVGKIKKINGGAGRGLAGSLGLTQDQAIILALAKGDTRILLDGVKTYDTSNGTFPDPKVESEIRGTINDLHSNFSTGGFSGLVGGKKDVNYSYSAVDLISLDSKSAVNNYLTAITGKAGDNLVKLKVDGSNDYITYKTDDINNMTLAYRNGRMLLKVGGTRLSKDGKTKEDFSEYAGLDSNSGIDATWLGAKTYLNAGDGSNEESARTKETGLILLGIGIAGDSFRKGNVINLQPGQTTTISDRNNPNNYMNVKAIEWNSNGLPTNYELTVPNKNGGLDKIDGKSSTQEDIFKAFANEYGQPYVESYNK